MSDYTTSGQITFAGLGSGTDFDSLVDKLMEVEHYQVDRLETWKASWEAKVEKFQDLNTQLLSLKSTLSGMDTRNEFLTKTATSSDPYALTASADSDALEGTHSIEVNQLAQNKIMTGDHGYSTTTQSITGSGASIFAYTYQGTTRTLTISAGTTLDGLKAIINNDADNPGVRAALVSNGDDYFLQVRGMDLGADADLTIDGATTLTGFGAADFTTTQQNQDSQIRVDGWPAGDWVSTASNTVSGVVEGLTFNLKEATSGSTLTMTVATDTDKVVENVQSFVDEMNQIRSLIKDLTKFDASSQKGSILTGNYGVQIISQNLKDLVSSKATGFEYLTTKGSSTTGDIYSSLSQLGITTNADEGSEDAGLLELDVDALTAALEADPNAVAMLFAAEDVGESNSSDFSYYSHIQNLTKAGAYKVSITTDALGKISAATINGHEATISGTNITGKAGTDEAGLVIRLDNLTPSSTFNGTVDIKRGKFPELVDELKTLTDSDDGPLKILERNYDDIMDSIDDKIDYEENRLSLMETNLREKYSRLDTTLGQYQNIQTAMTSAIAQLSTSS